MFGVIMDGGLTRRRGEAYNRYMDSTESIAEVIHQELRRRSRARQLTLYADYLIRLDTTTDHRLGTQLYECVPSLVEKGDSTMRRRHKKGR